MARTIGSSGEKTAKAIREAGIRLIYAHGFEAVGMRQLAAEVGIQPGSLYKYFANKQTLLFDIVRDHMDHLIVNLHVALEGHQTPLDRLRAFSAFHLRYHMTRKMQVYIANSELRSLEPENRSVIVDMRSTYERVVEDILQSGVDCGAFRPLDVKVATFALIALLTGICEWYRADGRLEQDALVAEHVALVLNGVAR
ncbi:TetR/AcrR family transcriptional regulator [Chthonobacter albigriseus]|uniref:TetR/AcrR family transcriptional regulator n=1 Tax=Chthonobacter albigriseus TaxID=1683161 RepID=UPI0015EE7A0D|nr:TetR/AcrR family transcriptional regulator [Chthonobacter albigriseus]